MAIIPDYKPLQGTKSVEVASLGSVMAAGKATAAIGESLANVGNDLGQEVQRRQQANDEAARNEGALEMQAALARHEQFKASNLDETTWEANMTQEVGAVREKLAGKKLSAEGRQKLDLTLQGWEQSSIDETRLQGTRQEKQRNRQVTADLVEQYKRAGKFGEARAVLDRASGTIFHPGEIQADLMEVDLEETAWNERQAVETQQKEIVADPRAWMKKNDPRKPPAGYDPIKWQQINDYAASQARALDVETSDSVLDGIVSNKITDPKQIYDPEKNTGFAAEMRPTDRQRLLDSLGRWNAEGAKAVRDSKENIAKNVGEFYTRLQEWQPDEEGQDPAGVELRMLIEELPEGHPLAAKMRESMGARKSRLQGEVTSKLDQGLDALNQAGERGDFGPLKAPTGLPVETRKAVVKDKFLQDTRKMQALGFDEDQAQQILVAAREDPALGQAKFNELWEKRPQDSINAAPFDIAVADAIRGENAFLQWTGDVPPEKMEEHQRAIRSKGEAILEYSKWIKANPNANETEIGAKMRELGSKSGRIAPISGPVKAPPPRPGTETSMTIPKGGLKLSNYGYPSDTTPDSNSARGIGHRDNKMIPGESAAISKSLADRLKLKHGDKLKIETTKGDFTVFYHDTVPATDKRTGDLPETIDIYRPKDGSNGWGGRVTKVSKI